MTPAFRSMRKNAKLSVRQTGASAMKALNGWQRIGIVLSVLWAIVGFFGGNSIAIDALGSGVSASYARCLEQRSVQTDGSVPKDTDWKPCQVAFERDWGPAVKDHWSYAAASAFIPILIAWLVVYFFVALGRWIAAGFKQQ
jgi:hypothetical protein